MIGYLEGKIIHFRSDTLLLLAGSIGYEILINREMTEKARSLNSQDDFVSLYIYYHQTERQPRPLLIGFPTFEDKEFFQLFITVAAMGPVKAVKAMTRPVSEIALAIEKKDVSFLSGLNGIGRRSAEKIIATLYGKTEKFITLTEEKPVLADPGKEDIFQKVAYVLSGDLGYSYADAEKMIGEAFERNSAISTPEELFDEIFHKGRAE